jgi:hypothetical protein
MEDHIRKTIYTLDPFRNNPHNRSFIYAVWLYGIFAIPPTKFTLEETLFQNTHPLVRSVLSNVAVLSGFSFISAMYGFFGFSHDFIECGDFGFRFGLKYLCVVEPARMGWKLWGRYFRKERN